VRDIAIPLLSRYRSAAFEDRCRPFETKVGANSGLTMAELTAILRHEGGKVASNWAKARLQIELKEYVHRNADRPAGIRFQKRVDVRACQHHGRQEAVPAELPGSSAARVHVCTDNCVPATSAMEVQWL